MRNWGLVPHHQLWLLRFSEDLLLFPFHHHQFPVGISLASDPQMSIDLLLLVLLQTNGEPCVPTEDLRVSALPVEKNGARIMFVDKKCNFT